MARKNNATPLVLPLVLICLLLNGCEGSNSTEQMLEKLVSEKDGTSTSIPIPDGMRRTSVSCVMGAYQNRLREDGEHRISEINKLLEAENFHGSEHKWNLISFDGQKLTRLGINRYKIPIVIPTNNSYVDSFGWHSHTGVRLKQCVNSQNAGFAVFINSNQPGQKYVGLISIDTK